MAITDYAGWTAINTNILADVLYLGYCGRRDGSNHADTVLAYSAWSEYPPSGSTSDAAIDASWDALQEKLTFSDLTEAREIYTLGFRRGFGARWQERG